MRSELNIETALCRLRCFDKFEKRELYKYSKHYGDAITFLSSSADDAIIFNVINILSKGVIIIRVSPRYGERYPVKSIPNRRLLLYKYLQRYNFEKADIITIKLLHTQLVKYLNIETDIIEILKVLNILYKRKCFYLIRNELLQLMQKMSFNRNKYTEKMIMKVLDTILHTYFLEKEKINMIKELLELANFGVIEFFICSSLFEVMQQACKCSYVSQLMKYVMNGFANNNLAFGASILFNKIVESLSYNEFVFSIDIFIRKAFDNDLENRTLTTSFMKYIVPICGSKYQSALFNYSSGMHLYYRLIVCKHIFIAKCYLSNRELYIGVIEKAVKSNNTELTVMAFELLCHFHSAKIQVTINDINLFKRMLFTLPELTLPVKRSIRYFISQITICYACHKSIAYLPPYVDLYNWIHHILHDNVQDLTPFGDIISEVYSFSAEVLLKPSSILAVPYCAAIKYDENPLYSALNRENNGVLHHEMKKFLLKLHIDSTNIIPVAVNVLKQVFYLSLSQDMTMELFNHFLDILPINVPWSNKKAIHTSDILLKKLVLMDNTFIIGYMKEIVTAMVNENIGKFISNNAAEDEIDGFGIGIHVEILTNVIQVLSMNNGEYLEECEKVSTWILEVIGAFNKYTQNDTLRHKNFRKNIEASLIAMIKHQFTAAKLTKYTKKSIGGLLVTSCNVINNVSLKKVIITTSQCLQGLMESTKQYDFKYISFYKMQKRKYLSSAVHISLRKSAGIRNIMHVILRTVNLSHFFRKEVAEFITTTENENVDQLNLKINILECLLSDANLKESMQKFIIPIFNMALKNLNHENFLIKNACVQLISVITTRLLGPLSESGVRQLSAIDVFVLKPKFAGTIHELLFGQSSIETKVCILGFLAESNPNGRLFSLPCTFKVHKLKEFFSNDALCTYAIEAYIACCPTNNIFDVCMKEFGEVNLADDDFRKVNCQVEVLTRLTERYVMSYPVGDGNILQDELDNLLHVWYSDNFAHRHMNKMKPIIEKPSFIPNEELENIEEEDEFILTIVPKVNCHCLLSYIKYIYNFLDKSHFHYDFNLRFLRMILGTLIVGKNVPRELIFNLKNFAINTVKQSVDDIKLIKDIHFIKTVNLCDINVQELLMLIICEENDFSEKYIKIINGIFENCFKLVLANPPFNEINIILNIIDSLIHSDC